MTLPPLPPYDHAAYVREQLKAKQAQAREPRPIFQPLLEATDDPPQWLAQDFLLANEYQLIAGEGGSFKTTVFLSVLAAVAGGYDVLNGFPTGEPRTVLLISGEDSAGVLKNRLLAIAKGHGWDLDLIRPRLHELCLKDVQLDDLGWQLWIEEQCAQFNAAVLGLDPMADLISGDENDNSAARPIIQWFRRLNAQGTAVLLCHHYGKATEHKQGMARIRGASAWMNAARAIYTIEEKDGSRWLGCGKLSRATRPEPRELKIDIQSEPANRAVWTEAVIALAHPPTASWMIQSAREMTPAERMALSALGRHAGEALSWSRWVKVAGVSESGLSTVIPRLKTLHYITAKNAGEHAGRPRWAYEITVEGQNALLPSISTPQLHANATANTTALGPLNSATPRAPIGGAVCGGVELPLASQIATEYGGHDLDCGPGLDPHWQPDPSQMEDDE